MKRTDVTSSNVNSIGYDADRQVLEVEFVGGGLYEYRGISPEEHDELMEADSVGRHLQVVKKTCSSVWKHLESAQTTEEPG